MPPFRVVRLVVPLLAVGALLCAGSSAFDAPGATAPATEAGPDVVGHSPASPVGRMLLGAYVSLSDHPDDEKAVEEREQAAGRPFDLQLTYYNWDDQFPDFGEAVIAAHGRTPLMTWYGPGKDPTDHRTLAEVNTGQDDAWITAQADAIKAFGKLVYLSPMPEMNGTWYRGFSLDPTAYVAAWRRIHGLFDQAGVTNVRWLWRPNITPAEWDPYYPGDAYVDVIGVDGYNTGRPWQSFQTIFGSFLAHYSGRKPLMVVETATDSVGGSAAEWIMDMHAYLKDTAGPDYGVIGVCWFDTDTDDQHNWRVDQTPQAWQAWLAMAHDPYFGGHG
jgi:hypothetical protein